MLAWYSASGHTALLKPYVTSSVYAPRPTPPDPQPCHPGPNDIGDRRFFVVCNPPPTCVPGPAVIDGVEREVICHDEPAQPQAPRVTLDVTEQPAGAVLEEVLRQTGYGYELTTGFVVSR